MKTKNFCGVRPQVWQHLVDAMRASSNPLEREAIYMGVVAADGSPVLLDRRQLRQHAHFLGATGGGKTSLGLAPLIEQLISFGDSTVIILDLKGDTNELLASVTHARNHLWQRTGHELPMRHFTIEPGKASCTFNPLASPQWLNMSSMQRTDVLAASCGLLYGSDYGRAFFSAANSAMIYAAERLNQGEKNFRSILGDISRLLHNKSDDDLPRELRQAGVHVYESLTRLASIEHLNLPPNESTDLDLSDCFRTPQIVYCKFPSTISQTTSSAIARLLTYFLATAAMGQTNRRQVYLVIDEFQRIAAETLSILLEQARSLDISLILSNQGIEDLGKHGSSLLNVIENNCDTRQWFSLGNLQGLKNMSILAGQREVEDRSQSISHHRKGRTVTETIRKVKVPRISLEDASYISDAPDLSIMKISGVRFGYSRYRGLPFVVRSRFHIDPSEYQRRRSFQWPEVGLGLVIARDTPPPTLSENGKKHSKLPIPEAFTAAKEIELSDWSPEGF